jgi:NADH:ubiquinone oxidoreductase subunit F (NADH-binding)
VLVGGYFGGWLPGAIADSVRLDSQSLKQVGGAFGCGSLVFLPRGACVLQETAAVLRFLAGESARQCGPCWNGLDAIAERFTALADGRASAEDVDRLTTLADSVSGRGACNHPEGALAIMRSCLRNFARHVQRHLAEQPCRALDQVLPTPAMDPGWR